MSVSVTELNLWWVKQRGMVMGLAGAMVRCVPTVVLYAYGSLNSTNFSTTLLRIAKPLAAQSHHV